MSKKRGQLTLFVILGVLLAGGMVGWFLVRDNFVFSEVKEVTEARSSLRDCFKDNFEGVIDGVEVRGNDSYFYDSGNVVIGGLDEFENELEGFFDVGVFNCVYFYNESNEDASLSYENVKIDVKIEDEVINVIVDLDLVINVSGVLYLIEFDEKPILIESDLKNMYDVSSFFVNYLSLNNEWIPLSQVVSMAEEDDLEFRYEEFFEDSEVVVSLVSKEERFPHEFRFYNKFNYDYPSGMEVLM